MTYNHYSGRKSIKFWRRINVLRGSDRDRLYELGVKLQNLEHDVMDELFKAEQEATHVD